MLNLHFWSISLPEFGAGDSFQDTVVFVCCGVQAVQYHKERSGPGHV